MIPLPNQVAKFVDKLGNIIPPWNSYLQQFTQAPPNIINLTVISTPFTYVAKEPGSMAVTGGNVSSIILTRGKIQVNLGAGTNKIIPVSIKDLITVGYSSSPVPMVQFIPSYGQAPA